MKRLMIAAGMAALMGSAQAQTAPKPAPTPGTIAAHPDWPRANPDDVKSPEAIITALSESISGDAAKPRDWNRVRSLFVPGNGRMITVRVPKSGPADLTIMSIDDYQARAGSQTFYEKPMAFQKQTYGHMTHVYESYGIFHSATDTTPQARGVNSWELLFDGTRYWILQIYWDTEHPAYPIPAELTR